MSFHLLILLSFSNQLSQECRVIVFHRQLKVASESAAPSQRLLACHRVLGWPVILLPEQADAALVPPREVIEIDAMLEQQLVLGGDVVKNRWR